MEMQNQWIKVDLSLDRAALSKTNMMLPTLLCIALSSTIAANLDPGTVAKAKEQLQTDLNFWKTKGVLEDDILNQKCDKVGVEYESCSIDSYMFHIYDCCYMVKAIVPNIMCSAYKNAIKNFDNYSILKEIEETSEEAFRKLFNSFVRYKNGRKEIRKMLGGCTSLNLGKDKLSIETA